MPGREIIDYAVFVVNLLAGHEANPLREVEVGSADTLDRAKEIAHKYEAARVVEAWQEGGLYHYGREVYRHGLIHNPSVGGEVFAGGWRRG